MTGQHRNVIVWGNCQAAPLAALLAEPLARAGLTVLEVPPVFLVDHAGLARVRGLVADAAFLLAQPIRDEYRIPGCGSDQLATLLPADGRHIRLPSAFDSAAFPFQALAHDGSGERIAAPVTDYHDLRLIAAAARGESSASVWDSWPRQPTTTQFAAHAQLSWDALITRERACDLTISPVIRAAGAMFSINHPSNRTLTQLAEGVLETIGILEAVHPPRREFLGSTRTAVERVPASQLGWSETEWQIGGLPLGWSAVITQQLEFYRARPDVVADACTRFKVRLEVLGLDH